MTDPKPTPPLDPRAMREFTDPEGRRWTAFTAEEEGPDYKGRVYLVMAPAHGSPDQAVELPEVRWNTQRTARRTLETMSVVELRRRLRSALGRSPVAA